VIPASAGPQLLTANSPHGAPNGPPTRTHSFPRVMTFSLLKEPWIPLIAKDGSRREASLLDVLLDPEQWRRVDGVNPIETLSLYRLLLAICHRALGPSTDPRSALLESWPQQALRTYLEQWAPQFDLLHPETPFLQVPALTEAGLNPSPWTRLALERASGATRMIWDHSIDELPSPVGFAEAARLLVAHLQFTPGGLVRALRTSAVRGPASGLLLMLPVADSLQQTLALGLIQQNKERFAADLPAWERPALTLEQLRQPTQLVLEGPAHRYTFLSRALLLLPVDGHISHLLYGEGLVTSEATNPQVDPMAGIITGKKGPLPLLLSEQKAFWRDFHVLQGSGGATAAATVSHAAAICQDTGDERPIAVLAGGLLPDQAKIVLWRLEERHLASALLQSKSLIVASNRALELAEQTGSAFNKAVYVLCSSWLQRDSDKSPDPKDIRALQNSIQAGASFWGRLESAFWLFIDILGTGGDTEEALLQWRQSLTEATRSAWNEAASSLGLDSRAIAAIGRTDHLKGKILATIQN
jgi:CRISPR system Cascade subunit CasA